ncbi:thiamine-phosphate kinase [Ralstonia pseudosolanacearum]|uniref:thiamine-phosphate kinase n=1 Tax=Ralstonia pseudosolanacearum TaxID=1310165 RepID=UPI003AAEBEDB
MKMTDIGEKGFLRDLLPSLTQTNSFINGFGNDASVVDVGLPDTAIAFKIDRAARPIAAYRGWAGFEAWGRLAVTANLSDILAVGARPTAFMLSLTVPGDWDAHIVRSIVAGAAEACREKDVAFVGGDTKEGVEANVVGAAIGVVDKQKVVSRKSARLGDAVVLAGRLGGFAGSYLLRRRGLTSDEHEVMRCLSHPECAWKEAGHLFTRGEVTSAVDLSDGLFEGLQLLTKDDFGVLVELDGLPLHKLATAASTSLHIDPLNFAFAVGDWGMLFTMPEGDAKLAILSAPEGAQLSIIGKVVPRARSGFCSAATGNRYRLSRNLTNEHFRRRMESETDYFSELTSSSILLPE